MLFYLRLFSSNSLLQIGAFRFFFLTHSLTHLLTSIGSPQSVMRLSFVFNLNAKHLYNQTHSVLPSNKIYGSIWSQKGLFSKMFCKSEPYIKYTEQIQNNALHPNLRSCANYYNWYKWLAKWNKEPVAVLLSLSLSLSVYFCLCISLSLPLCSPAVSCLSVSLFLSLLKRRSSLLCICSVYFI